MPAMIRSQPTYFQTPSDIASTDHGPASSSENGTNQAAPEPTGGFLAWRSVSILGGDPRGRGSDGAVAAQCAAATFSSAIQKPMSVVNPALRVRRHGCISFLEDIDPVFGLGELYKRKPQGGFGGDLAGKPSGPLATRTAPLPVREEAEPAVGIGGMAPSPRRYLR